MQTTKFLVHKNGPALWPEWKSLEEVIDLKEETPENIWQATYMGNPTAPEGTVFKRDWFDGTRNRFLLDDIRLKNKVVARYISWDTGIKTKSTSAYTAAVVGELLPDYRLLVRFVYKERLEFPELSSKIASLSRRFNKDGKLRDVIIEDKATGTSAYQTLSHLIEVEDYNLVPFSPTVDKETRANQAAVWCRNDCVSLPFPSDDGDWLFDFEDELFEFPGSAYMDQVDAFSQLLLWTENLLSAGYHARREAIKSGRW